MASFDINPKTHKAATKQRKISAMTKSPNENEAKVAKNKMTPAAKVDVPRLRQGQQEEIIPGLKLVDIILGEEKCGKGMYYCYTDKKCKKIPDGLKTTARFSGGGREPEEVGIDKPVEGGEGGDGGGDGGGGMGESLSIEDAFGNKFMEVVDLIKPEDIAEKCWVGYKKKGMKNKGGKMVPNCVKEDEVSESETYVKGSAPVRASYGGKPESFTKEKYVKKSAKKKAEKTTEDYKGMYQSPAPTNKRVLSGDEKARMSPGRRALQKSDDLERTEPGSKRAKAQKKASMQMTRNFKSARATTREEVQVDEAMRLPAEYGNLLAVVVIWRGRSLMIKMFFPQATMPKKSEIQTEIEKVYPGGRVTQFQRTSLPSEYSPHNSPILKVQKESKDETTIGGGNLKKLTNKAVKRVDSNVDGTVNSSDMKSSDTGEYVPGPDGKKVKAKARFEETECAQTAKGTDCGVHGKKCCPGLEEVEEGAGEKDACYHKVKSRYSVWPSAYASGALVKCRKKGAKNWGSKTKKEEVLADIAAEYFFKEGINDDGVDILIEELGLDQFVSFVEGLSADAYLTEERSARRAKKGAKSYAQVKAEIDAKEVSKKKPSAEKTKAAVDTAKKQQPKRRPVLDAIARQVMKGMERHNAAMKNAKETGKVIKKAGKVAGAVAKGAGEGIKTAGKAAKVGYKMASEEEDRLGK